MDEDEVESSRIAMAVVERSNEGCTITHKGNINPHLGEISPGLLILFGKERSTAMETS